MANQAAFKISGTPSVDPTTGDREYSAVLSETLTCTLEANPSLALSATFEIFDANDSESPFASKDAPLRTWNENGLPAITVGQVPLGINDDVTIDMPAAVGPPLPNIHSYVIRCTVSTPGDGSPESQVQVFERQVLIFGVNTDPVLRKTVPGETTQARVRAWSDSLNDLIDAMENLGVVVSGSLQAAYIAGNTIVVSAGEGPLIFSSTVAGATSPLDVSMDGTSVIEAAPTGAVNIRTVAGQNFNVTVDAGGDIELNAPSGIIGLVGQTEINFDVSGLPFIKLSNTTLGFRKDVIAPFINQEDETVDSVTGDRLTIAAQNSTGLTANGGDLLLVGGTGTAIGGATVIRGGLGGTSNGLAGFSDATGVGVGFIDGDGAIFMLPLVDQDFTATVTGTGAAIVRSTGSGDVNVEAQGTGDVNLDAAGGELTLDDVGNSGLTLSQANDRVLDQTGSGEVLDGATSAIGALNRLARASTLLGFIQGLHYANNGGTPLTIVDIDSGSAASEDGTFLIESSGTLVVDIAATGINGRDTGALTNAWWALWIIADSSGVEPVAGLLSLSFTEGGLTFPTGYDVARRVGAIRTIAALTIRPFGQPKAEGQQRWTYWKDNLVIQTDGTATTYTNTVTSAAPRVAPSAVRQQIGQLTSKLGGASILAASNVIPDGWNEAAGNNSWRVAVGFTGSGDNTSNGVIVMPVGPSRVVRYLVEPAGDAEVTIVVKGWEDSL